MNVSARWNGVERRLGARAPRLPTLTISHDDHGLAMVMLEISNLMGGTGAFLTMHPENGIRPSLIFVDDRLLERGFDGLIADTMGLIRSELDDGISFWRSGIQDTDLEILMMPVERAAGHSRLMISVVFETLSKEERQNAERLYRERRPFAIGYFHLWQTNRALAQRTRSLELTLDQTAIGVLLLNSSARIIFANRTGDEILAAGDGLGRSNGAPRATHLADGVNLQAALSHALNGGPEPGLEYVANNTPLLAFRRKDGPPLIAALLPSGNLLLQPSDIAAIMYIVDPVINTTDMLAPLCRLYGLSPVETRLACYLARGQTVGDAAAAMRIKEQTARSYLKTMFVKTSTNRQIELVALLLSSVIRMKDHALHEAMPMSGGDAALRHFS